jgi:hypothetical protein
MNAETTATSTGIATAVADHPILEYQQRVEPKSDAVVFWVLGAFGVVIFSALVGMLAWVGAFSEHL